MGRSKLQKAIGKVKDKTSIGLAKVGSSAALADLEVAIVKATRHDEHPADERHIREILSLTAYSRCFVCITVSSIARRLNKTKNWTVALKTLILVQRLLADGDPAFQQEILFATRRGTHLLNLLDFRDCSHSNAYDYSSFVRTYALYLDDMLEFKMLSKHRKRGAYKVENDDEEKRVVASRMMSRMQRLQQLLERFLACRPTGAAKINRIVRVALYPVVKESFQIYYEMTETMEGLIDQFMEMEVPDCFKVYDMFSRSTQQFDELGIFYAWSKNCGIARSSEYPEVERIPNEKLILMADCIRERSESARTYASETEYEDIGQEDVNAVKALPEPENVSEEEEARVEKEPEAMVEPRRDEDEDKQETGDLLNLGDDAVSSEEFSNQLALALFDSGTQWETFSSSDDADSVDWETALVLSASNLSSQAPTLGGGFDALLLNSMYQQEATMAATRSVEASGSASSVALGSAGRPAMLSLPAPPMEKYGGSKTTGTDPFAASVPILPPSYVQMSDMEKKQHLLAEEQMLWKQYAREGMQGQALLDKLQANPPSSPGPYRYG